MYSFLKNFIDVDSYDFIQQFTDNNSKKFNLMFVKGERVSIEFGFPIYEEYTKVYKKLFDYFSRKSNLTKPYGNQFSLSFEKCLLIVYYYPHHIYLQFNVQNIKNFSAAFTSSEESYLLSLITERIS